VKYFYYDIDTAIFIQLTKKLNKMKKTLTVIFLFVMYSFTIISCNKTNDDSKNSNSLLPDVTLMDYKIKLASQELELQKVSLTTNIEDKDSKLAESRLSIKEYENFESNFNLLLDEKTTSILTVLYLNPNTPSGNVIDAESIIAISKYYQDGNMLQHDFFNNIEGKFFKDKYLTAHVSTVTNNAIFRINEKVLKVNNNTILTITSDRDFKLKSKLDNRTDILRILANSYYNLKKEISEEVVTEEKLYLFVNKTAPDEGGNGCKGKPCYETGKFCYKSSGGISTCEPYGPGEGGGGGGSCLRNNNNNIIQESQNPISQDSLNSINNDILHYGFRDLLTNSILGSKYINYYYSFSDAYLGKVTLPVALKTARFLYKFNNQVNKLSNPSTYGQDIFLDSAMKNEIVGIINDYKNLYNDVYYTTLFNDILNDMNIYENKTVNEVLANF
jgi:hypothetical protein